MPEAMDNTSVLANSFATSSHDETSSFSEDDESEAESSEFDEELSAQRRSRCVSQMSLIEKSFAEIRDWLYRIRHEQVVTKLEQVHAGNSKEYLQRLQALENQKNLKIQIIDLFRKYRLESLKVILESNKLANTQHLNNEKQLLMEQIQSELDEKVHRLEEDRDNVDFSTEMWTDTIENSSFGNSDLQSTSSAKGKKSRKKDDVNHPLSVGGLRRRKKPVTVTGPYIVYMIRDSDIMDDWTAIKRAINTSQRRNIKSLKRRFIHPCRYEDGRFYFSGKCFQKGQNVIIRSKCETATFGTIAGLSATEVLVQQNNGTKSKLHVHHLQRGRYTLHPR